MLLYLVRLADVTGIDLAGAMRAKLEAGRPGCVRRTSAAALPRGTDLHGAARPPRGRGSSLAHPATLTARDWSQERDPKVATTFFP